MRNSIANFVKNLQISKDFAGNRVNGLGNVLRCGGEQTKRTVPLVTFIRLWRGWLGIFGKILNNNGGWGFTCGCGFTFLRFCGFAFLRFYVFAILGFYLREKGVFLEKKVCVWRKRCIFVG